MSHMVIYRGVDGKPGYHQTDDIHDAVGFVEQMRNEEGVEHARIFRLEEVVFEYRPYYRVELTDSSGDGSDGSAAIADSADQQAHLESGGEDEDFDGSDGGVEVVDHDDDSDELDAAAIDDDAEDLDVGDDAEMDSEDDEGAADASSNGDKAGVGGKKGLFGR